MSTDSIVKLMAASGLREGLLAPNGYRSRKFASFTFDVYDFPNSTLPIRLGHSGPRLEQLAGITSVDFDVQSGTDPTGKIAINDVVQSGLFSEGMIRFNPSQYISPPTATVPNLLFLADLISANGELLQVMGDVQQITMFEPGDAVGHVEFAQDTHARLMSRLDRLKQLRDGWDGEGSKRMSQLTGETAERVINIIFELMLKIPAVAKIRLGPLAEGEVRFECTQSDKELFLSINGSEIEVQAWQPLTSNEAMGYWQTDVRGCRSHLEWLLS